AYEHIHFSFSEAVSRDPWLVLKTNRDEMARKTYFTIDKDQYVPGGIYVVNIIDEEMKKNDPRLR
ncbi:MAG: hypothetical protein IKZ65_00055, partial [Lachnospiraceae bacterium]|nr:hypothetical protein [Lachnospiraceae bacterium]